MTIRNTTEIWRIRNKVRQARELLYEAHNELVGDERAEQARREVITAKSHATEAAVQLQHLFRERLDMTKGS